MNTSAPARHHRAPIRSGGCFQVFMILVGAIAAAMWYGWRLMEVSEITMNP